MSHRISLFHCVYMTGVVQFSLIAITVSILKPYYSFREVKIVLKYSTYACLLYRADFCFQTVPNILIHPISFFFLPKPYLPYQSIFCFALKTTMLQYKFSCLILIILNVYLLVWSS